MSISGINTDKFHILSTKPSEKLKKDGGFFSEKLSSIFCSQQIKAGFNSGVGASLGAGAVGGTIGVIKLGVESYSSATDQTKKIVHALTVTVSLLGVVYYLFTKSKDAGEK
jgi:hypothetical protein